MPHMVTSLPQSQILHSSIPCIDATELPSQWCHTVVSCTGLIGMAMSQPSVSCTAVNGAATPCAVVTHITVTHKAVPGYPQPCPHSPVGGINLVPLAIVYWYRHFLISGHVPHSVCVGYIFHSHSFFFSFLFSFFFFFFFNLFPEQTNEAVMAGVQEKRGGFPSNFLAARGLDSGFQFTSVLRGFQD